MVFMNRTAVYTVDTEQFELILTVECNEVIMDQAFLR